MPNIHPAHTRFHADTCDASPLGALDALHVSEVLMGGAGVGGGGLP
jgi:hypothetical protein